jgi:hypothetical protein
VPLETLVTDDIRLTAVLMSKGCVLAGALKVREPNILSFTVIFDGDIAREVAEIRARCNRRTNDYPVQVGVNEYEEAWKALRAQRALLTR